MGDCELWIAVAIERGRDSRVKALPVHDTELAPQLYRPNIFLPDLQKAHPHVHQ